VAPSGALIIGLAAGVICYIGAVWLKRLLGYDDSLDAFGIHGIGGAVGAVLTGVFALSSVNSLGKGLIDGNPDQVMTQVMGLAYAGIYCAIVTVVILIVVNATLGLRVSAEEEMEGLDITQHGERVQ
jgi:Amt family ammonium transporter